MPGDVKIMHLQYVSVLLYTIGDCDKPYHYNVHVDPMVSMGLR